MEKNVVIAKQCRVCKDVNQLSVVKSDYVKWQEGELIQNAMPYLTAGERELLISGTCEKCFNEMFGI